MKEHLYNTLIAILIILKALFLLISIMSRLSHRLGWDSRTVKMLDKMREESLAVSEVFMYLVLIVVFFPRRRVSDIKIGKEEQIIAFVLGILGIIHTQWDLFEGFFLDINKLINK